MSLSFTDEEVHAQAVRLGVIYENQELPRNLRSSVVASLAAERQRPVAQDEVPLAQSIVVEPGGSITVDDRPFPWVVQADRIEVTLGPDGAGMVRLTIPAANVQITKPLTSESENRA